MHLPAAVLRDAPFRESLQGMDFRALASYHSELGASGSVPETAVDLAWFWNSNAEWAPQQVSLADDYAALVGSLMETMGFESGDRVVLSTQIPGRRREAFLRSLPSGVEAVDWPARVELETLLDPRTRLVVMSKACGVTGDLLEIVPFSQLLAGSGISLVVEASEFVAHGPLDIRRFRCDAVLFAAGELFGAEGAALWTRQRRRPASLAVSDRTTTSLSGVIRYVEKLGEAAIGVDAPPSDRFGRREAMRRGMQGIRQDERILCRRLLSGLKRIPGVRVLGEADPARAAHRLAVVTFVTEKEDETVAKRLGEAGVRVESGDFGAPETLRACGVDPARGAIRVSLAHHHAESDVEKFLAALRKAL